MSRVFSFLVAAVLCVFGAASAQTVVFQNPGAGMQLPPRDNTAAKTGTAVIRGRVTAADSGQPLRKASVRIVSPELRETRSTTTDADGKYEVKELAAGRYQLSVSKGSFVTLSYGQSRPFEQGKPLQVADGQVVEKIDFALPRGAVITGRVLDEFGEPVADVRVTPMRYQFQQGQRRLAPSGRIATTNDIGEYRIYGLAPSQYYLSAAPGNNLIADMASGVNIAGPAATDDRSGYAPSYFPGTPNASEAQKIQVGLGQVVNDINFNLVPARLARITGTAVDSSGKPLVGGALVAMQRNGMSITGTSMAQLKPDGSFTLSGLAPGDYMLMAVAPGSMDLSETASAQVTVAGEDVNGVQLTGQKSTTGTGRVVVDAEAAKTLPKAAVRLMAMPARPEDNMLAGIGGASAIKDDMTFEVKMRPGRAVIRPAAMPPGWAVKAVRLNGSDVTDSGIEFRPNEDVSGIEVELTNLTTQVTGTVTNSRGEVSKDYTVIVFARDRDRWGYLSRFLGTGRPDQDGKFSVKALPAGEYQAVAVDYLEPGEATDPEFLDKIKLHATSFTLNDGETKTIDLKISSGQ